MPPKLPLSLRRLTKHWLGRASRRPHGFQSNPPRLATAVAKKLAAMKTETFFAERGARANMKAFKRILKRKGGAPPGPGDERD